MTEAKARQESAETAIAREMKVCEGCKGICPKESNRYFCPMIQPDGTIRLAGCGRGVKRRIPYAGKTFGDYEQTTDNATAIRIAKWFATENATRSLYLFGGTGTGKTLLAAIIAQHFDDVIFGDMPSLLGEIKRTFDGKGDARDIIDRYSQCNLLILDDLGAGQVTDWSVGIIYEIVNNRYTTGKRLIVTSNFDFNGLQRRLVVKDKTGRIVDSFTGKRIASRLSEMCVQAFLGEKDRRRKR